MKVMNEMTQLQDCSSQEREWLEAAREMGHQAGEVLKNYFRRRDLDIEAKGKNSAAFFADGSDTFSHMVSELESLLAAGRLFYRIHRSYIVNMMYVSAYDAKSVTLANGVTLPLKSRDFQRAYKEYIFRQMP